MKVLLDEDVPQPVIRLVEHLLRGHEVRHVSQLEWSGKKDVPLISDAARRGFHASRKRYHVTDPAIDPPSPYWR